MKKLGLMSLMFAALMAVGCAHNHYVKEMDQASGGAKVLIGSGEVKTGDKVDVFRLNCKVFVGTRGAKDVCDEAKIGEARVLSVLDKNSAIVKPEGNLTMEVSERMYVEKQEL